jgi:gliding motility-associated-like protein
MRPPILLYLALLLGLSHHLILPAQNVFPCDNRLIVSLNEGMPPSMFYWVELQADNTVGFEDIVTIPGGYFNALGYNIEDNLIYGWQRGTADFVRIFPDGDFEVIGTVPGASVVQAPAGDVTPGGVYIYYEQTTFELLFFDLGNDFELLARVPLFWDPGTGIDQAFTLRMDDLAVDPFQANTVYSYQRNFEFNGSFPVETRGQLLRIDADLNSPNRGMVTPVGLVSPEATRLMGSMFFNNKGQLFGYGSLLGFPDHEQNRLIAIDKLTGEASLLGIGLTATQSDGCSCPYNIVFEKTVSKDTIGCGDTELSFTFTLVSRHAEPIGGLELLDTLPGNMTITNVAGDFIGLVETDGAVGSQVLKISELFLPAGDSISITVTATASFDSSGTYSNQAYLFNLPSVFGGSRASDNPQTIGLNSDPTSFEALRTYSVDASISTFPTNDCQSLDSSRLVITSSSFLPDGVYEVVLTLPSGTDTTMNVSVTEDSSLVIRNLLPGDYMINSITAPDSPCPILTSAAATVPSSPASIEVSAMNDGPVCFGETVQLNAETSGAETLSWSGPNGFSSQLPSPSLRSATPSENGAYIITASLGFCQASDTTIVSVQAPIGLSVDGVSTLCDGDFSLLAASTISAVDSLAWLLPNGTTLTQDTLLISAASITDEGEYTVSAQANQCSDTATITLTVTQPPIVILPDAITVDLCESLSLNAEVIATSAYSLHWTPAGSLNCDSCLNPIIVGAPDTAYTLTATTAEGCSDSSRVSLQLALDKFIYIPNAFSPNGDGRNDYFELFPGCGVERILRFQIYNRWGSLLFDAPSFNPHQGTYRWDGYFRTEALNTSVYTWLVEVLYLDGTRELLSGDVQLVR